MQHAVLDVRCNSSCSLHSGDSRWSLTKTPNNSHEIVGIECQSKAQPHGLTFWMSCCDLVLLFKINSLGFIASSYIAMQLFFNSASARGTPFQQSVYSDRSHQTCWCYVEFEDQRKCKLVCMLSHQEWLWTTSTWHNNWFIIGLHSVKM